MYTYKFKVLANIVYHFTLLCFNISMISVIYTEFRSGVRSGYLPSLLMPIFFFFTVFYGKTIGHTLPDLVT